MAQSLYTHALPYGPVGSRRCGHRGEGVGVTHQCKVGVCLLGARLEALENVGDVDVKRNLQTPRPPGSHPPPPPSLLLIAQPPYLTAPADGVAVPPATGLHALVVGHESVPTVAEQPTPFDGPAPPRGKQVGDLLLVLFGEPVAQAILQLDTSILIAAVLEAQHQLIKLLEYILQFEALLECPIVGRNGKDVSIADARRHL